MPRILIVDDSAVDRRLTQGLLRPADDLELEFAVNGRLALEAMRRDLPDLVLTDLVMPELDGLELVDAIKRDYPLVPVILMTSKGSEETAVEALRRGASSYTPKKFLARDLLETIRSVLSVSQQQRSQERLLSRMTASRCEFVLENDSSLIPPLIGYVQHDAARLGLCDESERLRLGVALDEALANALYHGNLEISSELRDDDHHRYLHLVETRTYQPPYRDRRIHVCVDMSPSEGRFVIRDEGPGFDASRVADCTAEASLDKVGGRGLLLMRTFMDEVIFNGGGNEVVLIKRAVRRRGEEN
jgi:CheY-like chemotaxis protein/anti-sigma regulatory factor (Ser/Thr protein kinase)